MVLGAIFVKKSVTERKLVLLTGTDGGTYFVLGKSLKHALEKPLIGHFDEVEVEGSSGSLDNIGRLSRGEGDLALVLESTLPNPGTQIRVVTPLYDDYLHIVARKNAIPKPVGLRQAFRSESSLRVYLGTKDSGTKEISKDVVEALGIESSSYEPVETVDSFTKAGDLLLAEDSDETIDVAFFCSGIPTPVVRRVLDSGEFHLLSLDPDEIDMLASLPGCRQNEIPKGVYPGQERPVDTITTRAVLIARADLPDRDVVDVLETLFHNVDEILLDHTKASRVRFVDTIDSLEKVADVDYHPGVKEFKDGTDDEVRIATGVIRGRYWRLAKGLRHSLVDRGETARVLQTDGSLHNLELLVPPKSGVGAEEENEEEKEPTVHLAVMQYDTALAGRWGTTQDIHGLGASANIEITHVPNLQRLATLHREKVHIIGRRAAFSEEFFPSEDGRKAPRRTLSRVLANPRGPARKPTVCVGPEKSGSHLLGKAILNAHGYLSQEDNTYNRSVSSLVSGLFDGSVDVGIFTVGVPSESLRQALASEKMFLISVDPASVSRIVGLALKLSEIKPGSYPCQRDDVRPVVTLETQAVLVTTREQADKINVRAIVETLKTDAAYLDLEGGADVLATPLESLELNAEAEAYYREEGLLARPQGIDWLKRTGEVLAILVVSGAGYRGFIRYRRNRTSDEVGRRILSVDIESDECNAVFLLRMIRREIRDRVSRNWWQRGEIDRPRWQTLEDLILLAMNEAKASLTRATISEILQAAGDPTIGGDEKKGALEEVRRRIWSHLHVGEIDPEQHRHLLALLDASVAADRPESEG